MKILNYLIVLLITTFVSCTKKTTIADSRNDSIEKYLKLASVDTFSIEIRKSYNSKAFSFIDLEKNDSVVRWYLCEVALNFSGINDSANYCMVSKLHFNKSYQMSDTLNLARFYRYRGSFHKNFTSQNDSAMYYYKIAEKFYKNTKDVNSLAKVILFKGQMFSIINDYSTAELEVLRARKIFLEQNDKVFLIHTYNLLGNIYKSNFNYKKALIQYKKGLDIIETNKLDSNTEKALILNYIGNLYFQKKDFQTAISYYIQSAEIKNLDYSDGKIFVANYSSIFSCKVHLNQLDGLEKEFEKILFLVKKYNSEEEFWLYIDYSNLCYLKGQILEAQKYADLALVLAKKSKAPPYDIMNALLQVGKVNKDKASQAFIEYDVQADSLLNRERRERSKFLKIQLETDEIAQQKDKAIKQKWVQTSVITSVLLIVILLFIIYKQRSQKKEFILIQNQQKANEEIYQLMLNQQSKEEEAKQKEKKRIAIELHDNVMNKLASTRFNLFSLTRKTDSQSLEQAVHHIDSIKEVEDEIRNITHELSKETFSKNNSFASLLTQMINEQNQIHLTLYQLELDATINWDIISSEIKMNYYRIIQEAIHNCNKYALASHSTISLFYEANQLCLTIIDDGKGFEVEAAKQGIGLQNMKQRMESIDGEISINSELGKGTLIHCSVEIEVN